MELLTQGILCPVSFIMHYVVPLCPMSLMMHYVAPCNEISFIGIRSYHIPLVTALV
jgi:hypothetical protein